MEGLFFGEFSGLTPAVGPAEVGHADVLERPAHVQGLLTGVPAGGGKLEDNSAVDRGPDLRLAQQVGHAR